MERVSLFRTSAAFLSGTGRHSRPLAEFVRALAWILSLTVALIVWQAAIR
jgi:hypothetical protein